MSIADDPVFPIAESLLECLCSLLPQTLRGAVCSCCVYPGTEAPMDACCECRLPDGTAAEGQAWIVRGEQRRIAGGLQDVATGEDRCANGWAVDFTMGVYRCAAVLDAAGDAPTCDQIEENAKALASDEAALRETIICCFPLLLEELGGGRYLVGGINQITPNGGCMGTTMDVTVEFSDCCPASP